MGLAAHHGRPTRCCRSVLVRLRAQHVRWVVIERPRTWMGLTAQHYAPLLARLGRLELRAELGVFAVLEVPAGP